MKPDYGAYLHARGISTRAVLAFDRVPVDHVSLTDVPSLTTMVNRVEDGTEYAVSFDFTDEAAAHLLAKAPPESLAALERAAGAALASHRTVRFNPPILARLEARLTPLQRSPQEVFATLLVHRVD